MSAAAAALSIGGSLVKTVAGYSSGIANAHAYEEAGKDKLRVGAEQEAQIRDSARSAIGEQSAAQFSNGFLGGTGSAIDALHESAVQAALDALRVRRDAAKNATALFKEGANARTAARFGLVSGLLGTASSALGQKSDWAAARSGTTPGAGGGA